MWEPRRVECPLTISCMGPDERLELKAELSSGMLCSCLSSGMNFAVCLCVNVFIVEDTRNRNFSLPSSYRHLYRQASEQLWICATCIDIWRKVKTYACCVC